MKGNLFMQLIERWGSENPKFWNKLKMIGAIFAALIALALWVESYGIFTLPEAWEDMFKAIDGFFVGMFVTSAAGTTEPHLMDDKTIQNVKQDDTLR